MSELKRFLFSASVNDASGTQTFYIDAETAEAACERAEHRDTDGIYSEDCEVTDLGELELSSMEVTTVDDFGDFPPISTAPQPSGQDAVAVCEQIATEFEADPNCYRESLGARACVASLRLVAPSPAAVEPVELIEGKDYYRDGDMRIPMQPKLSTPFVPDCKPAVVGGEAVISADELAAFRRFCETCEDFESGGYDVPKEDMHRLARIGVVRWCGGSRYETTDFGDVIRARAAIAAASGE